MADWIGSDEHFFAPEKEDETEDLTATRQHARTALAQIVLSATLAGSRRRELLATGSSVSAVPPATGDEAFPLITGVAEGRYVCSDEIALPPPKRPVAVRFCPEEAALDGAVAAVRAGARAPDL